MHQCVRRFFELRREGPVKFEQMQEFFEQVWRSAGFEDEYQEQAYKKAGLEQLREFAGRHEDTKTFPIAAEEKFTYDMGDITLEGRIDQINRLPDQSVELIDYKTGRPPTQRDADKSLQLSVYALAARDELKLKPSKLTFYSLTSNERVSSVRTTKGLETVVSEIRGVAEQIRKNQFEPKPGFACKFCDYELICPAHEETYE
jgi:RecB family exonuclease